MDNLQKQSMAVSLCVLKPITALLCSFRSSLPLYNLPAMNLIVLFGYEVDYLDSCEMSYHLCRITSVDFRVVAPIPLLSHYVCARLTLIQRASSYLHHISTPLPHCPIRRDTGERGCWAETLTDMS